MTKISFLNKPSHGFECSLIHDCEIKKQMNEFDQEFSSNLCRTWKNLCICLTQLPEEPSWLSDFVDFKS